MTRFFLLVYTSPNQELLGTQCCPNELDSLIGQHLLKTTAIKGVGYSPEEPALSLSNGDG
jgi:hypothetical protein